MAVISKLPTYGYRRMHTILWRQARAEGFAAPNHKRVYRVMRHHGLLLQRKRDADPLLPLLM